MRSVAPSSLNAGPESRLSTRATWLVFAGVALLYVALLPPGNRAPDGNAMFSLADSLAQHHTLTVPCTQGTVAGRGGGCYSSFYPLLSFLLVPFDVVGRAIGSLLGVSPLYTAKMVALLLPALAGAGAAALTASIASKLGASRRGAVGAAVAFAVGTEAMTYARTLYAETLAAFFVALAVWGLTEDSRRRRQIGYAALVLAVLAKPQMIVVGPGIAVGLALVRRSWRPLIALGAVTAVGSLLYLGYNAVRFGDVLKFGGWNRTLSIDMFAPLRTLDGLAVLLFSPGRGVLWFSPVALIGAAMLWRRRRTPVAAACLGAAIAVLLLYSGEIGDDEWATRYLVPVLPLVCAALGLLRGRVAKVAIALAAIGLIVQIPTTAAFYQRYFIERPGTVHQLRWERFPVVEIWPVALHAVRDGIHSDVRRVVTDANDPGNAHSNRLLRVVGLWWWMLPAVGIPRWPGAILCLLGVLAAAAILWRATGAAIRVRAGPLPRRVRAAHELAGGGN